MAKVSVLEGWLCGFPFRSFQKMNSMLFLLIQRAAKKSRSGISQTKSTVASQGGGGGGGWAGAFGNVIDKKHTTHPFILAQN